MTTISIRSEQNYRTAIHIRDHTVIADELVQDGGADEGPTPMELLIGAVGGCIAVTTRAYAQRKHWSLQGISVEVEMERFKSEDYPEYDGDAPYVYVVREQIAFEGSLTDEQKEQLMIIAGKCPVHRVLESPVFFSKTRVDNEILT
jgi:putative redox protein